MNHILKIRNLTYLLTSLITLQAGIFFLADDSFAQDSNSESQLTTLRSAPLSQDHHGTTSHLMVLFELEDEYERFREDFLSSKISAAEFCYHCLLSNSSGPLTKDSLFSLPFLIYLIDGQFRL